MIQFSNSWKPVGFREISKSFLNFLSQKYNQLNFQDQKLYETEAIKENVVFKMLAEACQSVFFKKYHKLWNAWSYRLIFSGFSYIYDTYHCWKFQKSPWGKGVMFQKFCMVEHGITPLKAWILHLETTTEKI